MPPSSAPSSADAATARRHTVTVVGLPPWVDADRLLGAVFTRNDTGWTATLSAAHAADVDARLRGLGFGVPLEVRVHPGLHRPLVREARANDARRRRDTTPGFTRPGTRLDEEGRWSLTPEALALDLGRRARATTVIDAGCGAGGNAIGFARAGARVIAVERDARRLADARHNATVYGVADRIRFVHGDALDVVRTTKADLVFCDPPWSTAWDRCHTGLPDVPLVTALLALRGERALWAKLPPSFDASQVPQAVAEAWFGRAAGDRQRVKFLLLQVPPEAT